MFRNINESDGYGTDRGQKSERKKGTANTHVCLLQIRAGSPPLQKTSIRITEFVGTLRPQSPPHLIVFHLRSGSK